MNDGIDGVEQLVVRIDGAQVCRNQFRAGDVGGLLRR
jgi:hypothetical protein